MSFKTHSEFWDAVWMEAERLKKEVALGLCDALFVGGGEYHDSVFRRVMKAHRFLFCEAEVDGVVA